MSKIKGEICRELFWYFAISCTGSCNFFHVAITSFGSSKYIEDCRKVDINCYLQTNTIRCNFNSVLSDLMCLCHLFLKELLSYWGNKRRCYGQDEGCVGAGWFSKVRGPPSRKHPSTVNAIAICRNQGYSHVDKIQFGGNFNIHW